MGPSLESRKLESRKLEEITFHDKLRTGHYEQRWSLEAEQAVAHDPAWVNFKYYAIEQRSIALMRRWLLEGCRHASVLDYCCGNGEESLFVAKHGARRVVGIDISPLSIQNCQARARDEGLSDIANFAVMDAEALEFPDDSFDFIMEYGVLHHLDLPKAMAELARVLTPSGRIVCTETLGHNPAIKLYRKMTPSLRTAWEVEHILTHASFDVIRRHFRKVEMHFFHLATLGAVPFRRTPVFSVVLHSLRAVDAILLRLPWVQWHAWQVVFRLSEPITR
jgi:ubiquinone/menaquinone biosynthesis C-methylase UbiE